MPSSPSRQTPRIEAAQEAWLAARAPYQQTEAYRFGNAIVDDWEGKVNAWPLDEGLIDVAESYGSDPTRTSITSQTSSPIQAHRERRDDRRLSHRCELLRSLHEIDAIEANVATGYHAVEFLLWGQDLNGRTGRRRAALDRLPPDACTACERRRAYLKAATDLLVADLEEMVGNWRKGGTARAALVDGEPRRG